MHSSLKYLQVATWSPSQCRWDAPGEENDCKWHQVCLLLSSPTGSHAEECGGTLQRKVTKWSQRQGQCWWSSHNWCSTSTSWACLCPLPWLEPPAAACAGTLLHQHDRIFLCDEEEGWSTAWQDRHSHWRNTNYPRSPPVLCPRFHTTVKCNACIYSCLCGSHLAALQDRQGQIRYQFRQTQF